MDINYILVVVVLIAAVFVAIPVSYRLGRINQKATDISELPMVVGTILIETSDPDGPYLFFDMDRPIDVIGSQDKVICKVNTNGVLKDDSSRE